MKKLGSFCLLALLYMANDARAEGPQFILPYQCTSEWSEGDHFNVYISQVKGVRGALAATVPMLNPGPPRTWIFPCPVVPGQYYVSVSQQIGALPESVLTPQVAFEVVDPSRMFSVDDNIATTTLLNVRTFPGINSPLAGPPQAKGTKGVIKEGPIVLSLQRWWRIQYETGVFGYSSELYIVKQ